MMGRYFFDGVGLGAFLVGAAMAASASREVAADRSPALPRNLAPALAPTRRPAPLPSKREQMKRPHVRLR